MCTIQHTEAQLFSNGTANNGSLSSQKIISDSTKKKQLNTDDKVKIFYFTLTDSSRKYIDSSISFLHRSPLQSVWHTDLGNTGSAAQSLLFAPDMNPAMQLGLNPISHLLFQWQDVKFYNTTRPYTDIYYRNGSKTDQIISLLHTQNIKPNWNFCADYRKTNSPGFYKWQKTNHDNFALSTHYLSPGQQYNVKAAFLYNKLQQDENGGILSYNYLSSPAFNDKRLVPVNYENVSVNRSSVTNYYRNVSLGFQQQYFLGVKDSVFNIDSTEKFYRFTPVFSVKHQLYTQHNFYRYKDLQPDSTDYSDFTSADLVLTDSLQTKYYHSRIGNAFSLNGDLHFRGKVMQAEAGYGIEVEHIKNGIFNQQFYNNYLFANIVKPRQSEREWLYEGRLKIYFTGNTIGNFLLHAQAGRSMGEQYGTFVAGINQSLQTAPYLFTYYASNYFESSSNVSRQSTSDLYFQYSNVAYKTDFRLHYYLLGNYIYRDTTLMTLQYKKILPVTQIQLNKTLQYQTLVFGNQLLLQLTPNSGPLQLPVWASRHRLAYENKIFKRKLLISTGLEMRYNTPYYANDYAPVFFNFVTQTQERISNIPEFTYFFNFNVKRFRASLAFDQLQQIFTRNNINYPDYAAQNLALRFGLHWIFVN